MDSRPTLEQVAAMINEPGENRLILSSCRTQQEENQEQRNKAGGGFL